MFEKFKEATKILFGGSTKGINGFFTHGNSWYNDTTQVEYKSWAYACVSVIADRFSALQRHVEKNGKATNHIYEEFITREILQYSAISLSIYGEVYFLKVKGNNNKILSLEYINKEYITPTLSGKLQVGWNVGGVAYKLEDIIVIRKANPYDMFGQRKQGYGTYTAVSQSIQAEQTKELWNKTLMDNGAMPGLIVETQGGSIGVDELNRIKGMVDNQFSGVQNKSKTMVLTGGMKVSKDFILSHKDMDFIEGIKWDMEKIMAIFKVPKSMLGMGDGVNVGNVKAFETIFAKNVIEPLTKQIQESFTEHLFNKEVELYFDNVIPKDEEQIRNNYLIGAITRNEMRTELGYDRIKNGDVFMDGTESTIINTDKSIDTIESTTMNDAITKGLQSTIKGTDEYAEKRHSNIIMRADSYEQQLKALYMNIFDRQEKDVLSKLEKNKGLKLSVPKLGNTYISLYISLLSKTMSKFMQSEGQIAMDEVMDNGLFVFGTTERNKLLREEITKTAEQVDSVTDEKIKEVIFKATSNGLSGVEVRTALQTVFTDLKKNRLDMIVRTESTRAVTESQIQARGDSGQVTGKEWYTAIDERVCEFCGEMHKKIVELDTNYFDKGQVMTVDTSKLKMNYVDIKGPALHPRCRCTLLPIVKNINEL